MTIAQNAREGVYIRDGGGVDRSGSDRGVTIR